MPTNQEKIEVINELIKQTEHAVISGEISLAYENSNPWKAGTGTVEEKAKRKMKVKAIEDKIKENSDFLAFLGRYKAKLEK